MPQPEDDVPLAKLVATSSGPSDPDHSAAPTCKEDQATPAPATRQLRHTRSQSARKAPAAPGSTDAKAKQAAEGEEPEGVVKQDQPVESQQESAAAAASEPDAAVHDASAALAEADKDQPAASAKNSKSTEAVGPTAEPEESDITDITPSGIGRGGRGRTSKADNLTVTQPDDVKAPEVDEPKASKLDESRASRMEEPRASGLEEPPAKRPRRAAAANTGQKEPKEVNNGRGKEGNNGKAKEVMTGKAKGRGTQAKRGVVQESDTDDTEDIDIGDQEEDVDIGTNNEPYEQSVAAEDMEIDEKPQAQAGKKRPRKPEELPSGKGRPKPNPSTAKGPGPGAAKAGKGSAEGSGPAAKPGKGTSVAPAPTRAGPKEKRPGSGKHEASQAATNASPGDIAKQAAEVQKGVLKDAMKVFDDTRQAFEDARQALAEAADQVETSLSSIGQLSGLTMDILRDTLLGKEVGKLNKLARLHPTITDCERISSKASEVTTILKRAVGLPTQGPGQQPQGPSQQPKKPVPKADSRLTSPASPVMARTASATAAAPASAPAVATDPAAAAAAAAAHPLPDQMPGTSNGPEKLGTAGQPRGDSVRGKAVAILGLALTSPTDLTPHEAAVALEAAVFAHFAEHGEPGMRYKRRLHALWSYLRGTDQAPAVSQLRQKVLQGEIMTKTLAKIDRAQAQHLCNLKSNGATLPPAQAQAATAVPPPPPAGDPLPSTSSSGQMAAAPPPPTDDPPEFPASPPPPQSTSSVLLQAAASQPPAGTSNLASSSAMPGPDAASVAAPHASPRLAPRGPVIDPSADALSATATTRTSDNHAGAASQAVLEAGLRNETNLDASTSMRQHNHGPSAQAAPVWLPPKGLKVLVYTSRHRCFDSDSHWRNVSSSSFARAAYANTQQVFLLSRTQRSGCVASAKAVQAPRNNRQRSVVTARSINAAAVEAPPKIEVIKKDTIEVLKDFTAFDLDQYVGGGSKSWTFWNCEPSTFPWEYGSVEHAYILQGKFSVQYEGAEPVTIEAGDFVKFPVGMTTFVVMEPTRKFFNLA
ncbi:hypothetical protein WJX82_004103 [Trebouxia sp. C0006]